MEISYNTAENPANIRRYYSWIFFVLYQNFLFLNSATSYAVKFYGFLVRRTKLGWRPTRTTIQKDTNLTSMRHKVFKYYCTKRTLNQLGGKLHVWRKLPTLIAIPTTAGTGSEVTLASLITDSEAHRKYAIMSFPLIPHYAVLDATLTYTLPPQLTATTGIDALVHAVESYIGRSTTKETRQLALDSTKLIFENITKAYTNGADYEARANMLCAAYKAGIAFSKSYVGYIHAIAHSLGGRYGTPHGLANAVIMPYFLEDYGKCVYKKLHRLGVAAGVCTSADTHKDGAEKFIAAIKELNEKLNIPTKIADIKKEDIPSLAKHAEKEANPLYPVPKLYTKKELEKFYYRIGGIL